MSNESARYGRWFEGSEDGREVIELYTETAFSYPEEFENWEFPPRNSAEFEDWNRLGDNDDERR